MLLGTNAHLVLTVGDPLQAAVIAQGMLQDSLDTIHSESR